MGHYEERLQRDLEQIRGEVEKVGVRLDAAVAKAIRAFLTRDRVLAAEVMLGDFAINRATRGIDHLCHLFVARHLPSAGNLRFVSAVLRLSTALERIGDYAVAVSREAVQLTTDVPARVTGDVDLMCEQARSMLGQALEAFLEENADYARATKAIEHQADHVYRKVYRNLLAEANDGEIPVPDLFAVLVCFHRLERITDQAKNICEQTIFAVTGQPKQPKRYRILFVDERNAGPGLMAEAIAEKAFPQSGDYRSAGWNPSASLDPGLVEFMASRGHDVGGHTPRRLDTGHENLQGFHVIVALEEGAAERFPELPFATIFLDWSAEIGTAGRKGEYDDAARERAYKLLAPRIRDLVETLRGAEHAS
jgi:phosphate transport system protein